MTDLFGHDPEREVAMLPKRRKPLPAPPAPATEEERDLALRRARALTAVRTAGGYDTGYPDRVVRSRPEAITSRGVAALARLAWKYRRQMPPALVPATKPPELT